MKKLSAIVLCCLHLSGALFAQPKANMLRKHVLDSLMSEIRTPQQVQTVINALSLAPEEMTDYPLLFPIDARANPYRISSDFGSRQHPIYGDIRFHSGVDIAVPLGAQVYAAGNGTIIRAGYDKGYG